MSLSPEIPRPAHCYSMMRTFARDLSFRYNISISGYTESTTLMSESTFRFTTTVYSDYSTVPLLSRPSTLISGQTFFQEGSDFLWRLLSPLSSHTLFDTDIVERIADMVSYEVQEIFEVVDDDAGSSSESQPPQVPLWVVISVVDNSMFASTSPFGFEMVPPPEEAIESLLKKSRVVKSECCCCICLDEFDVNAECYTLPCQHFFHKKCILRWLHTNRTCPMCRHPLLTLKD